MPKGFYKHNHQGKKNPFFGKHHSLKSKERMSLARKGQIPWSKGKRGLWKHTEEWKKRMSKINKGKKIGKVGFNLHPVHSEEAKKKISEAHRGEKNYNWKGGKTKLALLIRSLSEYAIWRNKVFARDNWTCIFCKRKREKGDRVILQADHIYPLTKIIEDNQLKTIEEAISCEEFWNIKNGRTLCKECHKKTETWGINQFTKGKTLKRGKEAKNNIRKEISTGEPPSEENPKEPERNGSIFDAEREF